MIIMRSSFNFFCVFFGSYQFNG